MRRLRSPRGALQSAAWIAWRDAGGMNPGSPAHSESGGVTDLDLEKNISGSFLLLDSYLITGLFSPSFSTFRLFSSEIPTGNGLLGVREIEKCAIVLWQRTSI